MFAVYGWGVPVGAIFGQHDISGHNASTFIRSPLHVLESSRRVTMLGEEPEYLDGNGTVAFYGASFGQPIPKPRWEKDFNVLVIHAMIGDKELWPGQELAKPKGFLRKHPNFDLVLCGDYHYPFQQEYQGRWILNAGCLMRKTIGERDQKLIPGVHLFDTHQEGL